MTYDDWLKESALLAKKHFQAKALAAGIDPSGMSSEEILDALDRQARERFRRMLSGAKPGSTLKIRLPVP